MGRHSENSFQYLREASEIKMLVKTTSTEEYLLVWNKIKSISNEFVGK